MDKRAVADIQADMGGRGAVAAVGSVEEHEVARLEIALRDGRTVAQLTVRAVGQAVAELCVDVHREAGAVEPAGGCAAVDIADAEIALALSNEIRTGADLVAEGERYLGVRYVYGGASPSGFDCSGFTMYVYAQFGYSLPHGANRQLSYGTPISKGDLQPGDLVFFYGTDGGDSSSASHVGLYVGDGTFIHASSGSSRCVKYSSLYESYYTNHYLTARRIVG